MRIEYLLIAIVALLTLISVFGVGVAIGGGSEASTKVYLEAFTTVSTFVSSISALGTLIFLYYVRNDWLKPKEHEVINEFKFVLIEWSQIVRDMNLYLFGFRSHSNIKESIAHVETLILQEKEYWLRMNTALNKFILYFPKSKLKRSSLLTINDLRCRVLVSAPQYIKYMSELESYPSISRSFSDISISGNIEEACYNIIELV
ncbi:hypothetical protein [Vibrio vulnificus]|uniref:hypothetical protein n=1 Tax=Vibrio vulnificus TaxID=672 RepID=UPI003E110574